MVTCCHRFNGTLNKYKQCVASEIGQYSCRWWKIDFGKPHESLSCKQQQQAIFFLHCYMSTWKNYVRSDQLKQIFTLFSLFDFLRNCGSALQTSIYHVTDSRNLSGKACRCSVGKVNSSMFYGLRKAREKTTACDIPSGSEDSDLSDSDDEIQFKRLSAGLPPPKSFEKLIAPA